MQDPAHFFGADGDRLRSGRAAVQNCRHGAQGTQPARFILAAAISGFRGHCNIFPHPSPLRQDGCLQLPSERPAPDLNSNNLQIPVIKQTAY
jgi:hypothetical protein